MITRHHRVVIQSHISHFYFKSVLSTQAPSECEYDYCNWELTYCATEPSCGLLQRFLSMHYLGLLAGRLLAFGRCSADVLGGTTSAKYRQSDYGEHNARVARSTDWFVVIRPQWV